MRFRPRASPHDRALRVERLLGQGGFGRVYLGYDDELKRPVAIKVPNPDRIASPEDVEAYLNEARILASLDHPHIVPVHDVGRTDDGLCYVVSKYVEGSDLAARIHHGRPGYPESAALVATLAEALHSAHARGLVHRDVKPANILIDTAGKPFLADFGLALRTEEFGQGVRLAGTPDYMSPEQARGEGHRVDGRSDIFSLGVVFYELLTGRRPFSAPARRELLDLIATTEARPPRQLDDTIPKELERIGLKALARRASERYTTARDLADDLRAYLQTAAGTTGPAVAPGVVSPPPGSTQGVTSQPTTPRATDSDQPLLKVVPKGLRSFDEHDADFFLELLPGPRDRDGLPDSLRFWKTRVESSDPDRTFKVGLIYGPSGCGKSSLVKAGLLPRLAKHVLPVQIDATAEVTEARLLKGLRKACPELSPGLGLVDSLKALRQGRVLRTGQKALLVLDQFEQWLHARRGEEHTELVAALRQCDGEHVQAVVMVRDDFWLAASRFMRELEIRLLEGENSALVDLFDPRHARKVLTAFGRAYGTLSQRSSEFTRDQESFLDQSLSGLAQDGKVVPVRLALFSEMVKGKPWTQATLHDVGGTEGVGVTFLEETFSASSAPPEHRLHQKAAQAVLKALLPETGTDIKGQMRSEGELQAAAAYAERPSEFTDLLHILDNELRLITPTDPEGVDGGGWLRDSGGTRELAGAERPDQPHAQRPSKSDTETPGNLKLPDPSALHTAPSTLHAPPSTRYYQLTHDYLVHSLRDWLTRKQRETRRGRAELRLAERSSLWSAKPENRHLLSVLEWANIRLLTRKKDWNGPQRKMMERAGRLHGLHALSVAALVGLLTWGGIESYGTLRGSSLVESLKTANTADVPTLVRQLGGVRRWANPRLKSVIQTSEESSRERLHASLALLPVDSSQVDYLFERLVRASSDELPVLRDALKPHQEILVPRLWSALESAKPGDPSLLPAASVLADYAPTSARWENVAGTVTQAMVGTNPVLLGPWLAALKPVRGALNAPLADIFRDKDHPETERALAANILTDYASNDPTLIADLMMDAEPKAFAAFFPIAERQQATTLAVFQDELEKKPTRSWNDAPLDPAWTTPDATLTGKIESAQGLLAERFGFCQTMPLDEFLTVAGALRSSGYRPTRFRPYADGKTLRVAAVWTRDGRPWRIADDQPADAIGLAEDKNRKDGFVPVDVAGYSIAGAEDNMPSSRFAALWVQKAGGEDDGRIIGLAASAAELAKLQAEKKEAGLVPLTFHAWRQADDALGYSGVWSKAAAGGSDTAAIGLAEADLPGVIAQQPGPLIDLDLAAAPPPSTRERATTALAAVDAAIASKPDDLQARFGRANALFQLGENARTIADLDAVLQKAPQLVVAVQFRAIAHARLGHKDEALADVATFQKGDSTDSARLYLAVVVAAELGEETAPAFEALEAALKQQPQAADLQYDAACAYALASQAVARTDKAQGQALAERAVALLKTAIANGYSDYKHMQEDTDLDPLRDRPDYAKLALPGRLDRSYSAVWAGELPFEASTLVGLDPTAHLQRCRERSAQGERLVALSVASSSPEGSPVTASVWYRPVITEDDRDRLAERQARAAVALLRMGQAEPVIPLLRHSADPRVRSFIVNGLSPLGAEARTLAAELARIDPNTKPTPAPGQSLMDAVLFHPETAKRRALILALGTYGMQGLSSREREPLAAKLLDLYRNDPDSGIHGAVAWTLRQWGQQAALKAIDAELMKLEDRGERRWFVNSQGQTFALIEGPVEFRMGSPPTEPDRIAQNELPHRRVIPRRFAMGTTEVSVRQFQRFRPGHEHNPRYGPDEDGPVNDVSWYLAAEYCNWLSRQEGLAECYEPNASGSYAAGMKIKPDSLQLTGYRLPTEAEWEYACRAGTETSRPYGQSLNLLGQYAWYAATAHDRAWPGGSLQPNDLGLFDMLGNNFEWCQDPAMAYRPDQNGSIVDNINTIQRVDEAHLRLLRGGTFDNLPAVVRSANREWNLPSNRIGNNGFRLARTYP